MDVKIKPRIRFRFDEAKTAQAAAHLLMRHGGKLPHTRLIKLLYLADRQALLETGMTITGDKMVSMDRGPVLSNVYDLIKGKASGEPWSRLLASSGHWILSLREEEPPTDELSSYELCVLDNVDERFGDMDLKLLIPYLHQACGEWQDPKGSSIQIHPEEILSAEHRTIEEIKLLAEDAEELWALDTVRLKRG